MQLCLFQRFHASWPINLKALAPHYMFKSSNKILLSSSSHYCTGHTSSMSEMLICSIRDCINILISDVTEVHAHVEPPIQYNCGSFLVRDLKRDFISLLNLKLPRFRSLFLLRWGDFFLLCLSWWWLLLFLALFLSLSLGLFFLGIFWRLLRRWLLLRLFRVSLIL